MTKVPFANVILKPGKIYILRNPLHRDAIVKIGRTTGSSETRASQISTSTGVPYPFEVLYEEDVIDCQLAERLIHEKLEDYRINKRREFFQLPLKDAVRAVFEICLSVNQAILIETSRLVVCLHEIAAATDLRDILQPFRGGTARVFIIFTNEKARCEIDLSDSWMIECSAELIVRLKQCTWVDDVFVSIPQKALPSAQQA